MNSSRDPAWGFAAGGRDGVNVLVVADVGVAYLGGNALPCGGQGLADCCGIAVAARVSGAGR